MSAVPSPSPATPTHRPPPERAETRAQDPLASIAFRRLLLIQAGFGAAYSVFHILPKHLIGTLHVDAGRVGLIMASVGVVNVLGAPLMVLLVARVGGFATLAVGSLMLAMGSAGFVLLHDAGALAFTLRGLQGFGWALAFAGAGALVPSLAPPGQVTRTLAIQSSGSLLTNAIGPAFGEPLLARFGAPPLFTGAALVALMAAVLAARTRLPAPAPTTSATGQPPGPLPRRLLVVSAAVGMACGVMFTFHQPLALRVGITRVGGFLTAYTLTAVGLRLLTGGLVDRVGPRRVAFGAFVFYGAVVATMPALGTGFGPGGLPVLGALFGAAHGLFWPSFMAVCLEDTDRRSHARLLGWVNATFNGGMVTVAPLGALATALGYAPMFGLVGLLTAASALLLREQRGRSAPEPALSCTSPAGSRRST
jgi:MFS family permease